MIVPLPRQRLKAWIIGAAVRGSLPMGVADRLIPWLGLRHV